MRMIRPFAWPLAALLCLHAGAASASAPAPASLAEEAELLAGRSPREIANLIGISGRGRERRAVVVRVALQMRAAFAGGDFDRVEALAGVLREAGEGQGYAAYFEGEARRKRGLPDRGHGPFDEYIRRAAAAPASSRGGRGLEGCYSNAGGICEERTGWINHLLANDAYAAARAEGDPAARRALLESARDYAREAIAHYGPDGFDGPSQLVPTRALLALVEAELSAPAADGVN